MRSSKPLSCFSFLPISVGSKVLFRSRGISSSISPFWLRTLLDILPLRELPELLPTGSCLAYPRCISISASKTRSASLLVSTLSRPDSQILRGVTILKQLVNKFVADRHFVVL
ncbi:hypothetical protein SODG_005401 [Sodalis praecaptivus]